MASVTLVDTNVLLRLLQPQHFQYSTAAAAIAGLRKRNADLCIAAQNLVEFWVVATRPIANNGLGMSPLMMATEVRVLRGLFRLLEGKSGVARAWERLAGKQLILGKQAHDAHLVAVMHVYAVTDILTFNRLDFERFPGISVLDPARM